MRNGTGKGAGDQAAHRAMRRGGAMGTSRPTATGPNGKWNAQWERKANGPQWDTGGTHGDGTGVRAWA